jgi:hypothetical protein
LVPIYFCIILPGSCGQLLRKSKFSCTVGSHYIDAMEVVAEEVFAPEKAEPIGDIVY